MQKGRLIEVPFPGTSYFSLLLDGSTDAGNIDDEIFLILLCDVDGSDEKTQPGFIFLLLIGLMK